MPGKTAAPHEVPFTEEGDKPASIEAATKPIAERVHKRLNEIAPKQIVGVFPNRLLIANASGVVTAVLASGDVTNNESGVFTIGNEKIVTAKIAPLAVTEEKLSGEAVGTAKIKNKAVTDGKLDKPTIIGSLTFSGAVGVGTGFTAKKTATGVYEITLTTELATTGELIPALHEAGGFIFVQGPSKKTFIVKTFDTSTVSKDLAFGFMIKAS